MNILFGLLFSWYLRNKDSPLRGGIFLINGKRFGLDETPESPGLCPEGHHEIIFVNLLMFFNLDDLEYQNDYPLTMIQKRRGA
jgi:hypothetical protein